MIPFSVIKKYREQSKLFVNCDNLKNRNPVELIREANLKFKTNPFKHQVVCTYLGVKQPNGVLFFVDLGGGKTKIILDILYNLRNNGNYWKKCLVLSPNVATISSWYDEVKKHSDFTAVELIGSSEQKWKKLTGNGNSDLVLLNYMGMVAMLSTREGRKMVINKELLEEFLSNFDVVVFDEIHKCSNARSLTFKVSRKLMENCKYRFGMTGTPINRNPMDLWAEFFIIDGGLTLGNNFFIFREAYFKPKKAFWGGTEWIFRKENEHELYTRIKNRSIRYTKNEMIDLPKMTNMNIIIEPSDEMKIWYNEIGKELFNKDFLTVKNTFVLMREICSGFLSRDGKSIDIHVEKENVLLDLLEDIPDESQVVIFLDFVKSGEKVARLLDRHKISYERLYGGTTDKVEVKNKFINGDVKVLVANIKSGGTGLNLQNANYVIFYEPPLSFREYIQACNRVHRPGQKNRVFIYNFITRRTVEERVALILKEGRDISKALIDGEFNDYAKI